MMRVLLVLAGAVALVMGRPVSPRKYVTLQAGGNTYVGTRGLMYNSGDDTLPVLKLKPLNGDLIFDLGLFDQITIEENGDFEVFDDTQMGAEKVVEGQKVMLWVYNTTHGRFDNIMSILFVNPSHFRIFQRIMQQYING